MTTKKITIKEFKSLVNKLIKEEIDSTTSNAETELLKKFNSKNVAKLKPIYLELKKNNPSLDYEEFVNWLYKSIPTIFQIINLNKEIIKQQ